jgi:hypothetical protein
MAARALRLLLTRRGGGPGHVVAGVARQALRLAPVQLLQLRQGRRVGCAGGAIAAVAPA